MSKQVTETGYAPQAIGSGAPAVRSDCGHLAGVLTLRSATARLPGDPVHAATFDFPVCHHAVEGVSINDLIAVDRRRLPAMIAAARHLESLDVRFIVTSCGLFAPFQREIAEQLSVPFLSSSLHAVSFLRGMLAPDRKVAVITAHSGLLAEEHVRTAGFALHEVVIQGMECYPEFARVVLQGGQDIDVVKLGNDVRDAAGSLASRGERIGAVVLECPNLVTFRSEIQTILRVPVFDIVNLANFLAAGYALTTYSV